MRLVLVFVVLIIMSSCGPKQTLPPATPDEPNSLEEASPPPPPELQPAPEPEPEPEMEGASIEYQFGNTHGTAVSVVPDEIEHTIENIKLTPEAHEFWVALDQERGYTYHFKSVRGTSNSEVNATVHGPPNLKVHKTAEDNGGDVGNFTIVYPETKNNPHHLRVWLVSGDEWTGDIVYSKRKTIK